MKPSTYKTMVQRAAERFTHWDFGCELAMHLTCGEIGDLVRMVRSAFPDGEHDEWAEDLIAEHMELEEEQGEEPCREDYD